ncbi:hypothetical protein KQI74_16815 [Paenibacillus barcinonensis]|uniref:hypothetical protein n=1 Tax=Paenibacillus barcinonensis TaxID=198119 RepID=UPI001C1129EE|nr:hypothetical protein [Paenibacillus barcinonensis]MBU5353949.1 hypothetical protein [Paenibacillus barcinonensis]
MRKSNKIFISFMLCLLLIPPVASAEVTQLKGLVLQSFKTEKNTSTRNTLKRQKVDDTSTKKCIVILEPLQTLMDEFKRNKEKESIEVSIMLKYDLNISKHEFLQTKFSEYQDSITDQTGFGGYSFFARMTIQEIEEVSTWEEISTISIPSDKVSVY